MECPSCNNKLETLWLNDYRYVTLVQNENNPEIWKSSVNNSLDGELEVVCPFCHYKFCYEDEWEWIDSDTIKLKIQKEVKTCQK